MNSELTKKQHRVLGFIRKCYEEYDRGPTVREVSGFVGSVHPNAAICHLDALEKKGWIVRAHDGLSRGIRLAYPGEPNREKALVAAAREVCFSGRDDRDDMDSLKVAIAAYEEFLT